MSAADMVETSPAESLQFASAMSSDIRQKLDRTPIAYAMEHPFQPPAPATFLKSTNAQPKAQRSLCRCNAASIEAEPIEWLWRYRIAIGKQTLLLGELQG